MAEGQKKPTEHKSTEEEHSLAEPEPSGVETTTSKETKATAPERKTKSRMGEAIPAEKERISKISEDNQRRDDLLRRQRETLERNRRKRDLLYALQTYFESSSDPKKALASNWYLLLQDNLLNYPEAGEFASQISRLKSEISEKTHALFEQELSGKEKEKRIQELQSDLEALKEKQNLSHLLSRVGSEAQNKLLSYPDFRALFSQESPHPSYVLSIDIRRSTELMLKARNPLLYAEFITVLARELREEILENYGIFDKFTGDGILAFFPAFYTGKDAGYFVLKAAHNCHKVFQNHYAANKHCFTSILKEIGLGIGIDHGEVQLVQIGGDFTVVGTPVVYACRMGGAEAGHTYLNQPAFEKLFEAYSAICDFEECEITIKHEGKTLAYGVELNGKRFDPAPPEWTDRSGEDGTSAVENVATKRG